MPRPHPGRTGHGARIARGPSPARRYPTTTSKAPAYPTWARRKIFPFKRSCPPATVTPISSRMYRTSWAPSTSSGTQTPVAAGLGARGASNRRPRPVTPARVAAARRACLANTQGGPSSCINSKSGTEPDDEPDRRRPRSRSLGNRRSLAREVEVEARQASPTSSAPKPGRSTPRRRAPAGASEPSVLPSRARRFPIGPSEYPAHRSP